jgi:D-alanyl-D-alanine carboxypeptidase/D-alanyl-D-alanine-endopeptidase (penicillin-binding protein 4)
MASAVLGLPVAGGAGAAVAPAQSSLDNALDQDMQQLGRHSGAYVVDLSTGQPLYASASATARIPASVQKLYTTAVALLQFGPSARLTTELLGTGRVRRGVWAGALYLRGGGDPTFGSAKFDQGAYGAGATVQQLVARVRRRMNLRAVTGRIVGDESVFDSLRGTGESGLGAVSGRRDDPSAGRDIARRHGG